MQDISFYIFFIFVLTIAYVVIKTRTDSWIIQILIIAVFVGVTGFRDLSVPDTPEYYSIFKSYNNNVFDGEFIGQEIGFIVFGKIIKNFLDEHVVYFGVIGLLNILLVRAALSNLGVNKCLGMISYISFYGLAVNFIFLRVGIAMSLFIYFFSLYKKKKWFLSSPVLILAPLFHKSIILPILVLPISRINFKRFTYIYILLFCVLFYFSGLSSFVIYKLFGFVSAIPYFSKYTYYVDNIKLTSGFSIRHVFNMVLLMLVVYKSSELERIKPLVNICLSGIVLTSLLSAFLWVDRITDALVMFNFIVLASFALERNRGVFSSFNHVVFFVFLALNMVFVSRIMTLFVFEDII